MLTFKNLTVYAKKKKILDNLTFRFKKGGVYALMGPNGSGKSTLAQALMGHPGYRLGKSSKISFRGKNLKILSPDKRAGLGLFLSWQSPISLSGVNVFQLLRHALGEKAEGPERSRGIDILSAKEKLTKLAQQLQIKEELLESSLNEGFSGGEKKKMEVLQALMLDPLFLIFDEIDTGVDVDSLRLIASSLKTLKRQGKTLLLITHYNRILKYLRPDKVLVMKSGRLVKTGDYRLAREIEKSGYLFVERKG